MTDLIARLRKWQTMLTELGIDNEDTGKAADALEAAQAEIGRLLKVKVAANQLRIRQTRDHIEVQIGDWNKLCEALAATGEDDD